MSTRSRIPHLIVASALPTLSLLLASSGCSEDSETVATGGTSGTGASANSGVGGAVSSGGSFGAGGAASGGATNTGGMGPAAGGAASGGAVSGGATGSGGLGPATGGSSAGGGAPGSGGVGAGGQTTGGGSSTGLADYNPDFVEFVGADCDLGEPTLLSSADHSLPDPFLMDNGSRMSSISEWACQRAWLQKNIAAFVHGEKPGTPDSVTGTVSSSSISVEIEHGGKSASYSVSISLPSGGGDGAVPGMFQADGTGVPSSFLSGEGVAALNYGHSGAESAFDSIYGGSGVADPIKWAWAVSRAIDVLVSERDAGNNDIIDPTALGTTGCSYAGKSAFVVGAYDERIALGIPMESGSGGLGSYRVLGDKDLGPNGGEDPEQVGEACGQGWLTSEVCDGNVDSVPADAHFLVAMYAPRGFTTLQNDRIGHLGPVAQFTALSAGAEVYKALGLESYVGYHGGNDGDPHGHCSFNTSQEETVRVAIAGFLTKTAPPANFMEPKLKDASDQDVDFDLANYIDWATPTLN